MSEICTIFTGGEIDDLSFIDVQRVKKSFVICADSGYSYAKELGIKPDVVIGDYDSLGFIPDSNSEIFTFPKEKDDTDLMLAIKEALNRGYKYIDIYGALGGRFDHTFGNIQSLAYISNKGGVGRIITDREVISILNPCEFTVEYREGFSLSLFAYSDVVENYCVNGTKYETKTNILNTFPLGISNEILGEKATISFTKGRLLMIMSKL